MNDSHDIDHIHERFQIHAYKDVHGNQYCRVTRNNADVVLFRLFLPGMGVNVSSPPRTVFTGMDGDLAYPEIYAHSLEEACGAAIRVMVARRMSEIRAHEDYQGGQ